MLKKTDFKQSSHQTSNRIISKLSNRPRKLLNNKTSNEVFLTNFNQSLIMIEFDPNNLPLETKISFHKLFEYYRKMLSSVNGTASFKAKAKKILSLSEQYPELSEGFSDVSLLEKYGTVIPEILQDIFPEVMSKSEMKVLTFPFSRQIYYATTFFEDTIKAAGPKYELQLREYPVGYDYILPCSIILQNYYGYSLNYRVPLFYDIPNDKGIIQTYRILFNPEFVDILPTSKSLPITNKDFDELMGAFDNVKLWKKKIPPQSFVMKGFVIMTLIDVTIEQAISNIKSNLIHKNVKASTTSLSTFAHILESLFGLSPIKTGFMEYDSDSDSFKRVIGMESFLLPKNKPTPCNEVLCSASYKNILLNQSYFPIADIEQLEKNQLLYKNLYKQGFKSVILAPISNESELLGVLEIVTTQLQGFNSVNVNKLNDIIPFISAAVLRYKKEEENRIAAVIQNKCTSVHPSVYWKFKSKAKQFILDKSEDQDSIFPEIIFDQVYPLYGQIDIKDSSKSRNKTIQKDLMIQLSAINIILEMAQKTKELALYDELIFRVNNFIKDIQKVFGASDEQRIMDFIKTEINPVFRYLKKNSSDIKSQIEIYESHVDKKLGTYYDYRKKYDLSVQMINNMLVSILDAKQQIAQQMFPHYFERYKTDGVEHNMYIGDSISSKESFNKMYLDNLRLWQLQVLCEMENAHHQFKSKLPIEMEVTTLILVYSTPLSIRFRMDEKCFDVDGAYNARYEILKKRIDKSLIKNTNQRLTQQGKLSIVYAQKKDELEYLRYIRFLQSKGFLEQKIEFLEIEPLQGVTGLKALRVTLLHQKQTKKTFTYKDIVSQLNT